eukprot:34987_1
MMMKMMIKQKNMNELKKKDKKIATKRMELFHKQEFTASAIKMEVESIFITLQNRRKLKVTETTIDYYRRHGLKNVRLLQDDESLRFIYEQLARYVTFNPLEMKTLFDLNLLKKKKIKKINLIIIRCLIINNSIKTIKLLIYY